VLNSDSWWGSLESLWGEASDEIRALWEEVASIAPDAIDDIVSQAKASGDKPPKKGTRRSGSEWDFHLKGAGVGGDIVSQGGQRVNGDFDFSNYALRARHVDPSKLGVDTVKQYSGYLDAFEEDKHLFFCKPQSTHTDLCPK
jgi:cathepsin A (carboxypeptidase C)